MALKCPVSPDKNDPRPLVIYHGRNCPDGFAAALAAWLFYAGQAEFLALDYGDVRTVNDLPALAGRAVYILDFSFAEPVLRGIDAQAARWVMLDHHLSAAQALGDFRGHCGLVHMDMNKSGARLAWEFFHSKQPLPDLVRYVEDRDLWVWQYPQSAGFLSALDMEPFDFERWQALLGLDGPAQAAYIARGHAMNEKFKKLVTLIADNAQAVTFNGIAGLMVNAPGIFHSQLGDLLSQTSGTFALLWSVDKNGMVKCGLRSQRAFSCLALAQSMGGGGHAQACGFRMGPQRLPELLGGSLTA